MQPEAEEEPLGHGVLAEAGGATEAPAPGVAGRVANRDRHAVDDHHGGVARPARGERRAVVPSERRRGQRQIRHLAHEGRPMHPRYAGNSAAWWRRK